MVPSFEHATRLQQLLERVLASDNFNSQKLRAAGIDKATVPLERLPFTVKDELLADRLAHPPFGSALLEPWENYTRFCQTSGTSSGQPMAWADTAQSWEAMLNCWRQFYVAAGLKQGEDRIFFAFAFGPFLGFWTAFEAAATHYLAIPGGGLSSAARLQTMARYGATTLCCTPTYALRLGEMIGSESGVSLTDLRIRKLIVAGEPGGNVPVIRQQLEKLWQARVFDHHGMTEVGPVSFESVEHPGFLQIIEEAYLAEVIDPKTCQEVADGEHGELVLTTLNRLACPLLRYRTGDWVKKGYLNGRLSLEGGVLGRVDEMVVIRGVNVYPSAVENVIRQFDGVAEFQIEQKKIDAMDEIEVQIELQPGATPVLLKQIETKLRDTFAMRIPVQGVKDLPRYEFKSKRWRKA